MYLVTKRIDFCYGHRLLDYDGICKHPHGHNAVVEVDVRTDRLDNRNMVADFSDIKRIVKGWIDRELAYVAEEIERLDLERARYFTRLRGVIPDGDLRAVSELQRVAMLHDESKHAARHLLALADLYVDLSLEYIEDHPPEGLDFDPAAFRDLVDSGSRVYEMVSAQDGTPEKLEATRRLEAFLAFALSVDRDRFTP